MARASAAKALHAAPNLVRLSRHRSARRCGDLLLDALWKLGRPVPYPLASLCFGPALTLRVDPRDLAWKLANPSPDTPGTTGFIEAGDWSRRLEPVVSGVKMHDMLMLLRDLRTGGDQLRQTLMTRAAEGHATQHRGTILDTPEAIDVYLRRCTQLYESLRRHGYRTAGEIGGEEGEVGVAAGPGGALYQFRAGNHRLALACLLGLPVIVCEVRKVHRAWVEACMQEGGLPPAPAVRHGLSHLSGTPQRAT